jgi:hypothetical protein
VAKYEYTKGATSVTAQVFIQDSSSTTGAGLTGLVFNSAGLTAYYMRPRAAATVISLVTQTVTGAYSSGGFVEISATNAPGWYRLDIPDAVLAAGVDHVGIHLKGATNMAPLPMEIQLASTNPNDGVRGGMTALPDATADGVGGLPISDAGGLDLDAKLANTNEITAARMGALTDWIDAGRLDLILDAMAADVGGLGGAAMRGTDGAYTGTPPTVEEIADQVWDEVLTGATHNVTNSSGRILRQIRTGGGYQQGAIWIDTVGGTAGTDAFENGTTTNPVDTLADALTLSAATGINQFFVLGGSTITFAGAMDGFYFRGFRYTVDLNGQSVSGTRFDNAIIVGNDSGTNAVRTVYCQCAMGTHTLGSHVLDGCRVDGVITLAQAANYTWDQCYSDLAGTGTPSVDMASAAEVKTLSIRHYSGGIEFRNFGAGGGTHTASIEGEGQVVLANSCAGGTIAVRGIFTLTDNAAGAVTLSDDARIDVGQINVEADQALADIGATSARIAFLDELGPTNIPADIDNILLDTAELQTDDVPGLIAALNNLSEAQVNDQADLALADAGVTTTRTGYLDKLNITGNVASSAEVTSIQNNTRVVRSVPVIMETPDAGTETWRIELFLYDTDGNMEAPDSAPTVDLVDQDGTDLSSRLDNTTMTLVSTGRYRVIYTSTAGDALDQLNWTFTVIEGGVTRLYGNTTQLVDTTAIDFTAADRAKLDELHDVRLTSDRAGYLDALNGHVAQTGDSFARIGSPVGASISDDIATILAAIETDTIPELASGAPPTTPTLKESNMLLYMWLRNDSQSTASERRILNDAGSIIAKAPASDNGTTFSQGKLGAP